MRRNIPYMAHMYRIRFNPPAFIRNQDVMKLYYISADRRLHSHDIRALVLGRIGGARFLCTVMSGFKVVLMTTVDSAPRSYGHSSRCAKATSLTKLIHLRGTDICSRAVCPSILWISVSWGTGGELRDQYGNIANQDEIKAVECECTLFRYANEIQTATSTLLAICEGRDGDRILSALSTDLR